MKVLLLNPLVKYDIDSKYEKYYIRSGSRWPHSGVKKKNTLAHYLPFPFFLGYSAALLNRDGFKVHIVDAVAADIGEEDLLDIIKKVKPDLVFYEPTILTSQYDIRFAYKIKSVYGDMCIALGGSYATVFAKGIIEDNQAVDFILKGEYEFSLLNVARHLRDNVEIKSGIIYSKEGEIIDSGESILIDDLDRLPYPERDLFPLNEKPNPGIYWDGFCQNYPAYQLQASRGCPYRCYFCLFNQVMYNSGKYRTFSPQIVVEEMEMIKRRYKAKEIYFDDDDFTIDRRFVLDLCSEIKNRKLELKWSCMADAINIDEELIKTMADGGCIGIKFGVESGSEKIVKEIGKPIDLKRVIKVINICAKYGIKTHATFIFGLLNEGREDLRVSAAYIHNLKADSIQISIAVPYPGTRFYVMAQEDKSLKFNSYDGKGAVYREGINLSKLRSKTILIWFLKKWLSPFLVLRNMNIFFRTLRGMGIKMFIIKLYVVLIDELKNN
ncbi:MAG: radical SAM protein [Candidatus Kaelpia aquatica]|nr:radical SAM protein [Candidatus Kaelpia aquatica]